MADIIKWPVVLVCPGEDELPLLAELSARRDSRIVAVLDPVGDALGSGLAEIMGLPVVADLAEITAGTARFLVHPPLNDTISALVDQAADFGLEPLSVREFGDLASGPRLAQAPNVGAASGTLEAALSRLGPRVDPSEADLEFLEMETAAIHRTLSRIEEALDREALLRWLLGLATRATGARSGSIMLLDRQSEELYVAFAYGLSQNTQHRARVHLGEGVAGKVAETRRAELITEDRQPGVQRDRNELVTSICAPILWDGQVLGVINVSTNSGEAPLDKGALEILESLTHRFGLILDRFLSIQSTGDRELLRGMEEKFTWDTGQPETLGATLCAWATDVKQAAGADQVSLDILTSDGDLFTASPEGTSYQSPPSEDKAEVLSTGRPRVIRPGDRTSEDPNTVFDQGTIFHLPVGRDPLRALLTLQFDAAAAAHHFHSVSSEILMLLNRHLTNFLDRTATADQVDRLTTLASALSELGAATPGPANHDQVLGAARRLTGAAKAVLLTGEEGLQADTRGDESCDDADAALAREAARLLAETQPGGWLTTVMETGDQTERRGRSLMIVPLDGNDPFPGLVLLDKHRLHPLDGTSFTEFDALFARRLLPLLADRLGRKPLLDGADTEALAGRLEPTEAPATVSATTEALVDILHREMDRCDRYHTMLGLAAFRLPPPAPGASGDGIPDLETLVSAIDRHLRSSDHTACLEDGTILIIVPEDIQSMPRLLKRVTELLQQLAGGSDVKVACASRVYPGGGDTAARLLQSVIAALA